MKTKIVVTISLLCLMLYCLVGTVFAANDTLNKNGKGRTKIAKKSVKRKNEPPQLILEKRFQSDAFRMAIDLPENWKIIKKNQTDSDLTLKIQSPDDRAFGGPL